MTSHQEIVAKYVDNILAYYKNERSPQNWYPMFYHGVSKDKDPHGWVKQNNVKFLKGTPNKILYNRWFLSEYGAITALVYSPNGCHIIVGHSSGLIQVNFFSHI